MAIGFAVTVSLLVAVGASLRTVDFKVWAGIASLVVWFVAIIVGWRYTRSRRRAWAILPGPVESLKTSEPGAKSQAEVPANFPPTPKWRPEMAVDIPRTVAAFQYYFDRKKTLVVFAHGTCVPVSPESAEPEKEAMQALHRVFHSHPDFRTMVGDDGNYLISYSDAAFTLVFRDELDPKREYVERHHLFEIGVFGRSRMFLDGKNPVVSEIWRAESNATGL